MVNENLIGNQMAEIKEVIISEDCWIGAGVKILCGVNIVNGCIIGANSFVTKDIPACSIVVGTSAKVIENRDWFVLNKDWKRKMIR
jgi:acetyltransferase-like isoleucine patch superfamily enzyme